MVVVVLDFGKPAFRGVFASIHTLISGAEDGPRPFWLVNLDKAWSTKDYGEVEVRWQLRSIRARSASGVPVCLRLVWAISNSRCHGFAPLGGTESRRTPSQRLKQTAASHSTGLSNRFLPPQLQAWQAYCRLKQDLGPCVKSGQLQLCKMVH